MRKILIFICMGWLFANFHYGLTTMNLEEIQPGMVGIGKTVLQGNKVEEFEVEILGVLKNFGPDKNLILGKVKGSFFEKAGVIAGMSGSPVYVNDKIIGAIAYQFPFSKEPIAGITPIQEMITISEEKATKSHSFSILFPMKKILSFEEISEITQSVFTPIYSFPQGQFQAAPIAIPLVFSGFSPSIVDKWKPFFTNLGLQPVMGGSLQKNPLPKISLQDIQLKDGEPVVVQLLTGDFDISALGTVTYVESSKVIAFGHPLYNLGTIEYPMAKAQIVTVIPSLQASFKLANTGELVGTFIQDRLSGVVGEIGKMPYLIPLTITINKAKQTPKSFHFKMVNDRILTPALVNIVLGSVATNEVREWGDVTLGIGGDIYLENGKSVHLEDLFSGNFNYSVQEFSGLLAAVVYYLINNQFENLKIHKIDIAVDCDENLNIAYLEKALVNKYEARPDDVLNIKIFSRTSYGETNESEVNLQVPHLPAGSEFYILVGDAESLVQMETAQYRQKYFLPRSLEHLIRVLNNLRKNNRIYFKLFTSKQGIFLQGEEMPNLPPTIQSMLVSPRASSSPSTTYLSTIREYQLKVPFVFKGSTLIPVKIKE